MLIALERRFIPDEADLFALLPQEPVVAAITLAELWIGTRLADIEARRQHRSQFIDRVMEACRTVPFGSPEAEQFAALYVELRRAGQMIGERDLQIAATAIANGHEVSSAGCRGCSWSRQVSSR